MKKVCLLVLCLACILVNGCEETVTRPGQHVHFFEKEIVKKAELDYWLYLPEDYGTEGKTYPLLMFLHGMGERGEDVNQVLVHGIIIPDIEIPEYCNLGTGLILLYLDFFNHGDGFL